MKMILSLFCLGAFATAQAADKIEFNKDIRPILSENCFACHGPDKGKRKADLRLDDRESALKKGAIKEGKPTESELVARILLKESEEGAMPPPEAHKKLTAAQKETLKKWIEQGAAYQPHWAYTKLERPAVPAGEGHPVDAFIRAELAKRKITPIEPAAKHLLVRRLYLDIIGLPPLPDEADAFVKDSSPDAYEKMVDKLLASRHFGERMAQPWLDLVRFADTVGYHGDQNQRIFPYRDYVIDSFNKNKKFDDFTIEQIAGDLLPRLTTEQLVATGYNRLNMMTREGGAQPKEYIAKYQADRVRTTSITWLGSTFGCAECHDHKFDPITAKDFYGMSAFFADIKQWGVYSDYAYTPNPDLKGWTNDHPFPPEIEVENAALKQRSENLDAQVRREVERIWESELKDPPIGFKEWNTYIRHFTSEQETWKSPKPVVKDAAISDDGRVRFEKNAGKGGSHELIVEPGLKWLSKIALELLPDPANGGRILAGNQSSTTVVLSASIRPKQGKDRKVNLFLGTANYEDPIKYSSTSPQQGLLTGWKTSAANVTKAHRAEWLLDKPLALKEGDQLVVSLKGDNLGFIRLSITPVYWLDSLKAEKRVGGDERDRFYTTAFAFYAEVDSPKRDWYKAAVKRFLETNGGKAYTQVTVATTPMPVRLLPRGNWMDETGPVTPPATPGFLPALPNPDNRRLNRLDLAKWIVSKENPLTARVFVNRMWKQLFGAGLSGVMEDVGAQGEWPTHPELLDWLAVEFRDNWDVKKLVKLLVMSKTYQQSSKTRPELKDLDPGNRLLAFMPPRRLEAEFVRDNTLAIAGLLNKDIGGPSVKPYQPEGYYVNLQFPDRKYVPEADDRQYRRGVYMHWQRTFLQPMLANFDAPSREECVACRTVANTPQQALTLLNDPTFVEASRALAVRIMKDAQSDDDCLDNLYKLALSRKPSKAERESLSKFLTTQRDYYTKNPDEAKKYLKVGLFPVAAKANEPELAAWAQVCRVVINLHETITKY